MQMQYVWVWKESKKNVERDFAVAVVVVVGMCLIIIILFFFISLVRSFIYSFDLISCTVYKLNLMSFSIGAAAAAVVRTWAVLWHM